MLCFFWMALAQRVLCPLEIVGEGGSTAFLLSVPWKRLKQQTLLPQVTQTEAPHQRNLLTECLTRALALLREC